VFASLQPIAYPSKHCLRTTSYHGQGAKDKKKERERKMPIIHVHMFRRENVDQKRKLVAFAMTVRW
jgi:hypothetical protein